MKKLTIIFLSVFMLIGCNNNSKNTIKSDDFVITINDVTITEKNKYAYKHVIGKTKPYTYSEQLIEFIIDEIKKNPEGFVDSLKNKKR